MSPGDAERRPRRGGGASDVDRAGLHHRTASRRQNEAAQLRADLAHARHTSDEFGEALACRRLDDLHVTGAPLRAVDPEVVELRRWFAAGQRPAGVDTSCRRAWLHLRDAGLGSEVVLDALLRIQAGVA